MMRTKFLEEKFRQGRLDAKTLDNLFRRRIEQGANCSPFVSQAILTTVKEIYPLDPDDADRQLGLGQIKLLVVAADGTRRQTPGAMPEGHRPSHPRLPLRRIFRSASTHGVEGLRRCPHPPPDRRGARPGRPAQL